MFFCMQYSFGKQNDASDDFLLDYQFNVRPWNVMSYYCIEFHEVSCWKKDVHLQKLAAESRNSRKKLILHIVVWKSINF